MILPVNKWSAVENILHLSTALPQLGEFCGFDIRSDCAYVKVYTGNFRCFVCLFTPPRPRDGGTA